MDLILAGRESRNAVWYRNRKWNILVGWDQFFTSKRRTLDQLPGLPEASFARARHHIVRVGSVLLEKVDEVTVWFTSHGEGNASWSSI